MASGQGREGPLGNADVAKIRLSRAFAGRAISALPTGKSWTNSSLRTSQSQVSPLK
jgi:hypothetical protein